jgi:hypothetical protein
MDRPSYMMALKLSAATNQKYKKIGSVAHLVKTTWRTPKPTKLPKPSPPSPQGPQACSTKQGVDKNGGGKGGKGKAILEKLVGAKEGGAKAAKRKATTAQLHTLV